MKQFTAEYSKRGQYGYSICTADDIVELMEIMFDRGYDFRVGEREAIIDWSKTEDKKFCRSGITIRRGERDMTEYTSF